MGRQVMRVALDFVFPLGTSFAEAIWDQHQDAHERAGTKCDDFECAPDWRALVPKGEGWQLWQTVSDGPISPVFRTAEELIDFMCQPDLRPSPFGPRITPWAQGWTRKDAEAIVRDPHGVPSFAFRDGRELSASEILGTKKPAKKAKRR